MVDFVLIQDFEGRCVVSDPDGYVWGIFPTVQHAWEAVKLARSMAAGPFIKRNA